MLKTVKYLKNSLQRGKNPQRDKMVDAFRRFFKNWVNDFDGNVSAFTCVDGGYENGVLQPYFYLLTGDALNSIEVLRNNCKKETFNAQGFNTAELRKTKDDYYNKGKAIVKDAFEKFHPNGKGPHALFVYYKPLRRNSGKIYEYELVNAEFKPVNNPKNPILQLDKDAK